VEATVDSRTDVKKVQEVSNTEEYRETIRRLFDAEVRKILDEELRKGAQELVEEQRKAVKQIIEEHKAAIRQVVEEEKKTIWEKAELLRNSILRLGL
jgi:ATP-dependent Zn protease